MSSDPSKMSGNATWAKGQAKSTLGNVLGNEQMHAEGAADIAKGNSEYKAAQTQGYAQGAKDEVAGGAKKMGNSIIGDDSAKADAQAQKSKGQAQKEWNS
ncbi:MAG: hypothetical protein DHS80DRAFT_19396 [Piptocephalis tieghemiana]|nr:MAG: hypothetical protein DHS80DRAFT_19396 [Piptocephalis tieghemiana]